MIFFAAKCDFIFAAKCDFIFAAKCDFLPYVFRVEGNVLVKGEKLMM